MSTLDELLPGEIVKATQSEDGYVSPAQIMGPARKVYKDYAEILKRLGL